MRYGLPYKGSKNTIVPFLIDTFPERKNFYDMFAGGGSVTHGALLSGKFENYFMNDISDYPAVFLKAVNGGYRNERRWISREDFYRLKDTDPYVRYVWSFGNNGKNYLYSREVEPWKKALHYARVFNDFSLLEEFGITTDRANRITVARNADGWKEKYIKWYLKNILKSTKEYNDLKKNLETKISDNSEKLRNYLIDGLKKAGKRPCDVDRYLGTNGMAGHYFGRNQWEFPVREVYIKLQNFLYLPLDYNEVYGLQALFESLQSLQSLQRLQSLQSLQRLQSLQSLHVSRKSYDEVEVLPDSLIYCDIPYRGTDEYIGGFDHERFYKWCRKQKELVIISEYSMPSDFICVAQKEKRVTLSGGCKNTAVEKLFIPRHLEYMLKGTGEWVQIEFDFIKTA